MPEAAQPASVDLVGGVTDRRLLRGAQTRRAVARHAADVASEHGLGGLSIGRLAHDLGISKSGIQTLFKTKQAIQLAAIQSAHETFQKAVVEPVHSIPPGMSRLYELIERWIAYAQAPVFAGGCFWTANLAEFDSRPGPIRDALFGHHRAWLELLAGEVRYAQEDNRCAAPNAELVAFQIAAVLAATNIELVAGNSGAADTARQSITAIIESRP